MLDPLKKKKEAAAASVKAEAEEEVPGNESLQLAIEVVTSQPSVESDKQPPTQTLPTGGQKI